MKDKAVFIAAAIESIDLIKSYTSGYEAEVIWETLIIHLDPLKQDLVDISFANQ